MFGCSNQKTTSQFNIFMLKNVLGITAGNLASHIKVLKNSGLVTVTKQFVDNHPQTTLLVTEKGKEDFGYLKEWFYNNFLQG